MNKQSKKIIILSIDFFIILISFLIFLFLAIFKSYGWFSLGKEVNFRGSDITVDNHDFIINVSNDKSTWVSYDNKEINLEYLNFIPGQSKTLEIQITNNDSKDFFFTWEISSPKPSDEVPFQENGFYYYFGSQIKIIDILVDSQKINTAEHFLVTTSPLNDGQVTGISNALLTIPKITLIENLRVLPQTTVSLEIKFKFMDNLENQNIYIAPFQGVSKRRITFEVTR